MSISRARSWPLLDPRAKRIISTETGNVDGPTRSGKKGRREEVNRQKNCRPHGGSPQVQARRLLTRHYYPEGGWGWVVTVVSALVHLLGPGLQLSIPATLALPAAVKFYHHPLHTAGKFLNTAHRVYVSFAAGYCFRELMKFGCEHGRWGELGQSWVASSFRCLAETLVGIVVPRALIGDFRGYLCRE
ncbi:hypothetical protein WN55_02033 [Dufourea novaeangliae]|uniref:Uncharacterized protein n=1 Tax=Dufourea novaeangliae TaxID=178035 RepID=A0A154NWT6_DUFNO|nr:hypothetical protein WN55_02033 [Dufourea novaeangliae]